jgi:hypothetical protein
MNYLKESIRKIISQVLFGVSFDRLTPLWQGKINETVDKLLVDIIKPLRMMNSSLLTIVEELKGENTRLKEENRALHTLINQNQQNKRTKG